jgi:membrane protein implicated in regulation of membrane protease activity
MSWRAMLATLLAIMFGTGAALIIGSRYGDLLGRWAYVGMALSILSAISFTVLTMTKAVEVSDTTLDDRVSHES